MFKDQVMYKEQVCVVGKQDEFRYFGCINDIVYEKNK